MLKRLLQRWRGKPAAPSTPAESQSRADKYAASSAGGLAALVQEKERQQAEAFASAVRRAMAAIQVELPAGRFAMDSAEARAAMDSGDNGLPAFKAVTIEAGAQLSLMPWYMRQGFIGYQNAAFIAQHWLIHKACAVPVEDAIRNGYDITTASGDDIPEDALKLLKSIDRRMGIVGQMREFGTKGRIFGIRLALFEVESDDPQYYEKPFNLDGVKPHSYKGISQVDPYWCAPILDMTSAAVPSSRHFYEPTWWLIGSRKVHRSHLVMFKYADPPDVLKPLYLFGGIPLPQMIMERVYCAERTANEAPALALSKRTTVWRTNMATVMADSEKADRLMRQWITMRDNFGVKLGDKEGDEFQQFDTPLGDFDQLVMTQYGLCAAVAGCPITKLLGTTPGGFAATGDYDADSYHESEESMQEKDFSPLLGRHHLLAMRSEVLPKFKELADAEIVVKWHELDAMTHVEQSQVNQNKADTGASLVASGAISSKEERARVANDRESGYYGIDPEDVPEDLDLDDPEAAAEAARGGRHGPEAAAKANEQRRAGKNGKGKSA